MLQNCSGSTLYLWSGLYLQHSDSVWDLNLLYIFEIFILIASFPIAFFVLYLCFVGGGVFHRNLIAMVIFNVVNLFPALLSRLFFIYNELILGIQSGKRVGIRSRDDCRYCMSRVFFVPQRNKLLRV